MSDTEQSIHHRVVIAGGGTAGIPVAAELLHHDNQLDVAIIEPDDNHYYQPGWTLVGGGAMKAEDTLAQTTDCIPQGAVWYQDSVAGFAPETNQVELTSGKPISYDYLVVAMGLQIDWDAIDGLNETLGNNGVTSNYRYDLAPYTHILAQSLKEGDNALFTQPAMPIKCAGAPQKALYLTADTLQQRGINANIAFYNQGGTMFGVPAYARELDKVMASYDATPCFGHNLVAVDGPGQQATFDTESGRVTVDFDMLHVVPPQSAPEVIKNSPLAGEAGWITVDKHKLAHTQYSNVFALGDCADTPNAKTMAAVRRQFPVVVAGLRQAMGQSSSNPSYDGYGACPLTISHDKVILAEFRYGGEVMSSFPMDPTQPRAMYWKLKRHFFPWLYWNIMLKGKPWGHPVPKPRPALTE